MTGTSRFSRYRELEEARKSPLLVYVTGSSPGLEGSMARDAVPPFLDQLEALPSNVESLDLMIVSTGGDPTVAWQIVSLIRERVSRFSVLVPEAAFSAATLIALGADEIVMHPNGNLGPVDPQLCSVRRGPDGREHAVYFGSEDLRAYLEFAKESVGISDQSELATVFDRFCQEVGSVTIGSAARVARLSIAMCEKLLKMHMVQDQAQQALVIAEGLNKNFFHHGYPVSRSEAREIGLKIAVPNTDLEALVWKTWSSIEADLGFRQGFSPIALLRETEDCAPLFAPVTSVIIPPGTPENLSQQVYAQVLERAACSVPPVPYRTVHGIVESPRHSCHFIREGLIFGFRSFQSGIVYDDTQVDSGWRAVDMPPADPEV